LVAREAANFILLTYPGLIVKDSYWRWPERNLGGNAIHPPQQLPTEYKLNAKRRYAAGALACGERSNATEDGSTSSCACSAYPSTTPCARSRLSRLRRQ
jgi:hypothetical protein